jgi:intracellular sulfur oxidation DsrE/DsrF family protein
MKDILFFSTFILFSTSIFSQEIKPVKGPVIQNFGQVYAVENPDLLLDKNKEYKVIFDIYSDEKRVKTLNASINTVARFINMHALHGVDPTNLKIVVVLHGEATKNALSDEAFEDYHTIKNPNTELIQALKALHVKIYVCGQSFLSRGFERKDLSQDVELSLSALTALVYYQTEGYQLITFN